MQFQTLPFALLVAGTLLAFSLGKGWVRLALLLVASLLFYSPWGALFIGLLLLSATVDFCLGLLLERESQRAKPRRGRRRALLAVSICLNLGILGTFKYANFFLDNLRLVFGSASLPGAVELLLPPGISFYTFQTMSYTLDVYRGRSQAVRSPALFLLYVSFFPQLVAGPIERADRLIPQLRRSIDRTGVALRNIKPALMLIVWGLSKKLLLADHLGTIADQAFSHPAQLDFWGAWIGSYAFALQIYCDFSAYSEIAKGTALLFGVRLMWNFDQPYLATNPSDFWRRWHISLSEWFRDYVFIPLGGSRLGRARTLTNLAATMFLSGLWHGAAWTFVAWGLVHGVWLVAHAVWRRATEGKPWSSQLKRPLARVVTWSVFFHLLTLSWVLFRADSFSSALLMLGAMLKLSFALPSLTQGLSLAAVGGFLLLSLLDRRFKLERQLVQRSGVALSFGLLLTVLIALFGYRGVAQFIYFQF